MSQVLTARSCSYRTELLSEGQAQAFGKLLLATGYEEVFVVREPRAKSDTHCWYVCYAPKDAEAHRRFLGREQEKRVKRALKEGPEYEWAAGNTEGYWLCRSLSDSPYEVSETTCDCPDFTTRCLPWGLKCKHTCAYLLGLGKGFPWKTYGAGEPQDEPEAGMVEHLVTQAVQLSLWDEIGAPVAPLDDAQAARARRYKQDWPDD